MHNMKPSTQYKIITVVLVCENENESYIADGLNETLRECMVVDSPLVVDYSIDFSGPCATSDDSPEEGDLLPTIVRPAVL